MRSGAYGLLKQTKVTAIVVCLALFVAGCGSQPTNQQTTQPTPTGAAAAVQTHTYQAVGVVKALNLKRPGSEIDHEEIVGLMPAMQMEFPVSNGGLLNGIAVNDRVDFTVENGTGEMTVIAIKKK